MNALFPDDLIQMFKEKAEIINTDEAFRDPIFKMTTNTLPAGESLIWALQRNGRYNNQLRYLREDESYEKEPMDKSGS